MGLLAGSNVMLLTILWGTCLIVGKCDLENSVAVDEKDTKSFSLTGTFIYASPLDLCNSTFVDVKFSYLIRTVMPFVCCHCKVKNIPETNKTKVVKIL